jgi:ectoine hydroxylase-related dioxygenase (phytanoyl-CoA dioxygenase family)
MATEKTASSFRLDIEEVRRFHEQGFLGPFQTYSRDEMADVREAIEDTVLDSDNGPQDGVPVHDRHRDRRIIYDLVTQPEIVDRMASIYGEDLLLWATHFWNKQPGDAAIPWHQDGSFWSIEPPVNISAWIAIDDVTEENSCVNIVPGSHRETIPHVEAPAEDAFDKTADLDTFDQSEAVSMELEPGEFFLFNERTLHQSDANTSDMRRLGMSMRVTVPFVNIEHDDLYEGHLATVISGEDRQGINQVDDQIPD